MKTRLINENFKSDYLINLLKSRGVENIEEFLNPTAASLQSWRNLDNIEIGAYLLNTVINDKKPIMVVVDCDVDGFTSGAIIYQFIKDLAPDLQIDYIIHEHKEHGLRDCYEQIINSNIPYGLVILPDSSSNDYEYHEKLAEVNIPCLILDHHEIDEGQLISGNAIIINNQLSKNYTNKDLTGAGVTWQFCLAFDMLNRSGYAQKYIDLAALGVCGDMGSVLSLENRFIMKVGFENITNYFFTKAIEKQSYSMGNSITAMGIAFYIVPLMNAMIRVGSMDEKQRLFLALIDGHAKVPCNKRGAKGTFEEVAIESLRECTNAKSKQTRITDQMVEKLEAKIFKNDLLSNKILFIRLDDDDDFPSEINGLIAMKLAAKYKRPTLVGRLNDEGIDRGSIRNVSDCELTDLKAFLNDSGYFEYVQGHANAAGFSIPDKDLRAFHEYANDALSMINFNEGAYDINFERLAMDKDLEYLIIELGSCPEIWGQNCNEPRIGITDINITQADIQIMGAKKDTLKITKNGIAYMKFHAEDMINELKGLNDIKLNIVGKANLNNWMGNITPQVFIDDYEIIDNKWGF